ncbi:DedA family protein [Liquorilactobacillus vini]|uniref:DedA family protein n=1 Tax=Liquorilactobacillus vini TaxID=238015 RepID=UPI0002EC0819
MNNLDFFSLISLLSLAAIAGDSLNFKIGQYFGNTLKNPNWQRWIKPQDLRRTNNFYYKYGRMAIFLGRFIPVIRTIIPFTAGIGKMKYQDFILFNLLGGFSWVFLITSGGFLFGNLPFVKSHFELLLLVIILFSLSPFLIIYFQKSKEKSRQK